jgi:hypothetical protein
MAVKRAPRQKTANKKERKAVAAVMGGASQRQAVKAAGWSASYAQKKGYQVFQRPIVQSLMTDALERRNPGIVDKAAQRLDECLDAEKFFPVTTGHGEDKKLEVIAKPDFDVQLKAVDRVMDAYGTRPAKMEMPAPPRPPINITFIIGTGGKSKKPQTIVDLKSETARPRTKPFTFIVKKPAGPVPPAGR